MIIMGKKMKISFDSGFIEIKNKNEKISILISAKDYNDKNKTINNMAELSIDDFKQLISDLDLK